MRLAIAIVAALASIAAKPAPDPAIPFELYKGHIFVSASVNGKGPYLFGFDTGASGVGRVDSSLTAELSLPKIGEEANSDGITTVATDAVAVGALKVGDLEKRNLKLLSRDYNHGRTDHALAGIIGRDFFADRLVTIDYPNRRISFAEGALSASDPSVVAYSGSFVVPVCFASGCYPAKVDTGSSRSIVVPKDLVAEISASAPRSIGAAARTNSMAALYEMDLMEPVRIGGITAAGQTVFYAEPSDAMINVGSDFLKDYVLTIDQQHKLLKIEKPKP
jgi:predicted aspartyl protease